MNIPDSARWDKGREGNGPEMDGQGPKTTLHKGLGRIFQDWVLLGCILLTASLCFGIGLLAGKEDAKKGDSLWIEQLPKEEVPDVSGTPKAASSPSAPVSKASAAPASQPAAAAAALPASGAYVASKTGTKYYLPTCGTANRIKDENKVWFATKADAEKAGYEPSTACKGL